MILQDVDGFNNLLKSRYDKLRYSYFSAENLIKRFTDYMELFDISGAAQREVERWNNSNGIRLDFESEMEYTINWIEERVSYLNNYYGAPIVEPVSVTGVNLNQANLSMLAGNTFQLVANISPADADNKLVSWTSSNKTVATVSSTGLITALAEGTTTITVTTNDGGYKATCTLSVVSNNTAVTGVTLNRINLTLIAGNTFQLVATVNPDNATNKTVVWSSSNNTIATVSANGLVTALKEGNATITATTNDGGYSVNCNLVVDTSSSGIEIIKPAAITVKDGLLTVANAVATNLTIINMQGAIITQADGTNEIYVDNLPKGIYLVRINTEKTSQVEKFIIK